ncbi:hypothetical protein BT96DRAFT_912090 [Gymnopus androsaceus JB14]|uniref:Uncharacterized protein n=1 Tax=Gymnopus androsaceus JB14 TaxID=1447944 RepID=A0A6A4IM92_9AGAR|nr:hypothetical protein BT96DRAFT_912090 [Gymnopus androsaceus JB14]
MSKNKRVKSHNPGGKRDNAAKDAVKKKRKTDGRASKFKNAELKATLDSQAHLLYDMSKAPMPSRSILPEANVHDLTAVLGNL